MNMDPQAVALAVIAKLCPRAKPAYVEAFRAGREHLVAAGVTTPLRLAHLLAQMFHETGALTVTEENMNYRAERIRQVWPTRPEAAKYAGDPRQLGNSVYGARMGNQDDGTDDDDGYRYRGRGFLQTTGKAAYRKYGKRCGVDFVGNPDLILSAEHALKPALAEWVDAKCNAYADADDILRVSRAINVGNANSSVTPVGMDDRRMWLGKVKPLVAALAREHQLADVPKPVAEQKVNHPVAIPVPTDKQDNKTILKILGAVLALLFGGSAASGSVPWGALIIGAALLAGAGVAAFLFLKHNGILK